MQMEKNPLIFSFVSPFEASTGEQRAGWQWGNPAGAVPVFSLCPLLCFVSPSCELSLWLSSVTLRAGALAETANCSGRGLCTSFGQGHWALILLKQVLKVLRWTSVAGAPAHALLANTEGCSLKTHWGFSLRWGGWALHGPFRVCSVRAGVGLEIHSVWFACHPPTYRGENGGKKRTNIKPKSKEV